MNYATALVFVLTSVIFLVAGIVSNSRAAFGIAAVMSAVAVILLAQRVRSGRIHTFVNDPPPRMDPPWVSGSKPKTIDDIPADLEIDHIIASYRTLVAAEVLPTLEALSADELRKVIDVERAGRNRQAIIRRADELIDLIEGKLAGQKAVIDPSAPARKRTKSKSKSTT